MEDEKNPMKYIADKIDEYGYTMIATEAMVGSKNFRVAYTIGMAQKNLPEFMVVGLSQENSAQFLHSLVLKASAGELELFKVCSEPTSTLLLHDMANTPLRLVDVTENFFGPKEGGQLPIEVNGFHPYLITRYYEDKGIEIPVQIALLCYPDAQGLFFWEAGCDMKDLDLIGFSRTHTLH